MNLVYGTFFSWVLFKCSPINACCYFYHSILKIFVYSSLVFFSAYFHTLNQLANIFHVSKCIARNNFQAVKEFRWVTKFLRSQFYTVSPKNKLHTYQFILPIYNKIHFYIYRCVQGMALKLIQLWGSSFEDGESEEKHFLAITPWSTLTRNGSTFLRDHLQFK